MVPVLLHYRIYSALLLVSIPTHIISIRMTQYYSFTYIFVSHMASFLQVYQLEYLHLSHTCHVLRCYSLCDILLICSTGYILCRKAPHYAVVFVHQITFCFYHILSLAPCSQTPSFSNESVAYMATVDRDFVWTDQPRDWNLHSTFHPRLTLPYGYGPGHCPWNFRHKVHIHMADRPVEFTTMSLCTLNIILGK
jgi:hypothetical protein